MVRKLFSVVLSPMMVVLMAAGTAQAATNADVDASATVIGALSIAKTADVAFGNIGATTPGDVFLDPQETANTYVGTTADAGKLSVTGQASQSIRLGWPASIQLNDGGSNNITMTLAVSGYASDNQASSADLTLSGGYVSATTSGSGAYFLWVGGNLGTLSSQTAGTYTGTANFTVEYN